MRANIIIGFIYILIFLTPMKALADISPAEAYAWDYRDFCRNTVPAYVYAYKDGEREIIIMSLQASKSFKKLEEYQKNAFLRLLDYFSLREESGQSIESISLECQEGLDRALEMTNWKDHRFCKDVAFRTIELLGEDSDSPEYKKLSGLAYRKCMSRKIEKRQ